MNWIETTWKVWSSAANYPEYDSLSLVIMLNPNIFREYDIRGIADEELLDPEVELLGRALATYLIRHSGHAICLGCDCRLSGDGFTTPF